MIKEVFGKCCYMSSFLACQTFENKKLYYPRNVVTPKKIKGVKK
jgi:hypothetical protein